MDGYGSVLTIDHHVSRQLKVTGCDVIAAEKANGARSKGWIELKVVFDFSGRRRPLS